MGTLLKVFGIIVIVMGIIPFFTAIGTPMGIGLIVNGIVLISLGTIYNDVKEIKAKLK
ncbi:MAG: EmrE protein [candidate division WOR-3 bacterium]